MKVGIVGSGFVGAACAKAMLLRGSCSQIVLFDTKTVEIGDGEDKRTVSRQAFLEALEWR